MLCLFQIKNRKRIRESRTENVCLPPGENKKKREGSIGGSNFHGGPDDATTEIMTSSERLVVAVFYNRERVRGRLTAIFRSTPQVTQITIVGGKITDRVSLALTAALNLATSTHRAQLEGLFVHVRLSSDCCGGVGGALRLDHTLAILEDGVDAPIVGIHPAG